MTITIQKMQADMQAETKRYALQIITCLVGGFAAGVAALALVLHDTLRSWDDPRQGRANASAIACQ